MSAKYELVIGLETHVELQTESKIFCSCGGHAAAEEPNDCVCPGCSGMPGTLPVMNKKVIELAVTAGLMLNCDINRYTTFDKKNYYYPDLPCAYQITQLNHPICTNGKVTVKTSAGSRDIRINRIHMEEDAGKLVHKGNASYIDFNRTSVPLIEIVTEPDFRSAEEVVAYLNKLKSMFRSGGISECEEGAMRCDVNVSVREEGTDALGVRSEMKNMSSFESIEKAINYEFQRHVDAIEFETEELVQETRRFDDASGKTFAMRNKETEADYRYFPDPNLMPIVIDDEWLEEIKNNKPEAMDEKMEKYQELGIPDSEIDMIFSSQNISDLYEKMLEKGHEAKTISSWILTECVGILRKNGLTPEALKIDSEKLSWIIEHVTSGDITRVAGKKVLNAVLDDDVDPEKYCDKNGLISKLDDSAILDTVKRIIGENEKAVSEYLGGKDKALQAVFGACMREFKGTVSPAKINEILRSEIKR